MHDASVAVTPSWSSTRKKVCGNTQSQCMEPSNMYMICHPPDPPRYLPSPPLRPQQHLRVRITRQCLRRAPPPCCPFCPHALRSPPSGGRVPSVSRRVPARVTFRLSDHQTTCPCQHRRCCDASDTDLTSTVLGCPPYAPGSTHTAQDRRSPRDAPTRHALPAGPSMHARVPSASLRHIPSLRSPSGDPSESEPTMGACRTRRGSANPNRKKKKKIAQGLGHPTHVAGLGSHTPRGSTGKSHLRSPS